MMDRITDCIFVCQRSVIAAQRGKMDIRLFVRHRISMRLFASASPADRTLPNDVEEHVISPGHSSGSLLC
jgi:hypothetical protein